MRGSSISISSSSVAAVASRLRMRSVHGDGNDRFDCMRRAPNGYSVIAAIFIVRIAGITSMFVDY
jgi:hypothetical protein